MYDIFYLMTSGILSKHLLCKHYFVFRKVCDYLLLTAYSLGLSV
jgi:hypothetical protein